MPPRALTRSPFAGIGSASVSGASSINTSPERPSSSLGAPVAFPSALDDGPLKLDHLKSPASRRVNYSSAVSESLSKAYFYDVVLEADSTSASIEPDTPSVLLPWLGNVVVDQNGDTQEQDGQDNGIPRSASGSSINAISSPDESRSNAGKTDPARFQGRVQELIDTEKSYVRRVDALYTKYALPLRKLAKDRDTAIIPIYEAQRLFGNIGEILGANQAFLLDLESLAAKGQHALKSGLGDIVYRHMSCFSCYTEYLANFEKAKHIEQTLAKHRGFQEFADRTKYSMTGLGNVGLRDLLMEPIQRIPRYKMMLDGIIKYMDARDPQRGRLEDAIVLASRIANCEVDDKTKRAAVLWSFNTKVDSFPAGLISVHREFIDCVDVDDFPLDAPVSMLSPGASISGSGKSLHCTLILFDDRVAIIKRASAGLCGRKMLGLDDLNKLSDQMKTFTERSSSVSSMGIKKGDLAFRGVVNIMDVEALDLGGSDFQLSFLKSPAKTSGDKWTNRPVRQYVTSETTSLTSTLRGLRAFDSDMPARVEKTRFLESLWRAKALFKAKEHRSHVRCQILPATRPRTNVAEESRNGMDDSVQAAVAKEAEARRIIYWNVYTRSSYLSEPLKAHIALHVNLHSKNDPIPFGPELIPPHASLEVVTIDDAYGECAISKTTKVDPEDCSDLTVVQIADLPVKMTEMAFETNKLLGGQMTLFSCVSQPNTPSGLGGHRTKVAAGLEHFGRSLLFGGAAASVVGSDVFGSPARRTKSNASRSTVYSSDTPSTSSRAMTFSTNATSVSSRTGMLESFARSAESSETSSFLSSPKRLLRKGRSSSVGPPATVEVSPDRQHGQRMAKTPEPGLLFASSAVGADERTPTRSPSPFQPRSSSRLGGTHHHSHPTPSRTTMAEQSANDLNRTPSAVSHPSGPKLPGGSDKTVSASPAHLSRTTTPLNIRRKPVPRAMDDENDPHVVNRPSTVTPGQRRIPSGSKRTLPSGATPTLKPLKRMSTRQEPTSESESEAPPRPSISESEESTEQGHGDAPTPSRRGFSRGPGKDEAKRRAKAVYETIKSLKAEISHLCQIDTNDTLRHLEGLIHDLDRRWAASYRQTDRVLDTSKLEIQVAALERKCALLTTLETDGRMENTVLHKAFNEELDAMYEDTLKPEDEQLNLLRRQIASLKRERNEMNVQNKKHKRDLELEKAQTQVYRQILEERGLL